jgi:hypothetical protein
MAMTHLQAFKAALVALWTSWRDWFVGSPEQADEEDGSEAWLRGAWRWVQDQEPA